MVNSGEDRVKLDVLEPEIAANICSNICGSKCCNFILNDHYVPVEIIDYYRLNMLHLDRLSIYDSHHRTLELINKPGGNCIFLHPEKNHCTIYPFRPRACRNYPFNTIEGELPDWCELHHQSSDKLIAEKVDDAKFRNKREEGKFDIIPADISEKFIRLEMGQELDDYGFDQFDETISDTELWWINAIGQSNLTKAKETISKLISENSSKDWFLVDIISYSEEFELQYQIQGVYRVNTNTHLPHIPKFPQNFPSFASILSLYINTKELRNHTISGATAPDEAYSYLEELIENDELKKKLDDMYQQLDELLIN